MRSESLIQAHSEQRNHPKKTTNTTGWGSGGAEDKAKKVKAFKEKAKADKAWQENRQPECKGKGKGKRKGKGNNDRK